MSGAGVRADTIAAATDSTVAGADSAAATADAVTALVSQPVLLVVLVLVAALLVLVVLRRRRTRVHRAPVVTESSATRSHRVQLPGAVLSIGNAQDRGARREQEDSFGCSDTANPDQLARRGVVAVVADGMGGLAFGREASQAAVRAFLRSFDASDPAEPASSILRQALFEANAAVLELADEADVRGDVGTTLVAAHIRDGELHWIGAGDSRLYLLRGDELRVLTVDHSYARTLERRVAAGVLTVEQAAQHPDRHALISFLGQDTPTELSLPTVPEVLQGGDRLLLCSDGVYGTLSAPEIAMALRGEAQPAAEALVAATLAKGRRRQDNLTAVVLVYEIDGA